MIFIKVVWLFFLYSIIILIIGTILSKIKVKFEEFDVDTEAKNMNTIKIKIEIYLFHFFKIYSISINKKNIKNITKFFNYKQIFNIKKQKKVQIKKSYFKFEKLKIDLQLGFENVILTGQSVAIISTILSIIINLNSKNNKLEYYYKIIPIYKNRNVIKLKIESIISIKMVHILYVILKLRRKENGRTSNRRTYANSNG